MRPSFSSKGVLVEVIPDMVKDRTTGFSGFDENENEIQIFMDVVGYIGTYPEVADKLDDTRHTGSFPCHLCSFRRSSGPPAEGSAYFMENDAHSADSAFMRSAARTEAIRSAYSAEDTDMIGLKPTMRSCREVSPLFAFAEDLKKIAPANELP